MLKNIILSLEYLNAFDRAAVTSYIILMVGMTRPHLLQIPPAVEGTSWDECWRRGLERIATAGRDALDGR